MKKDSTLQIRLSTNDKLLMKALAKRKGETVSQYLRNKALKNIQ